MKLKKNIYISKLNYFNFQKFYILKFKLNVLNLFNPNIKIKDNLYYKFLFFINNIFNLKINYNLNLYYFIFNLISFNSKKYISSFNKLILKKYNKLNINKKKFTFYFNISDTVLNINNLLDLKFTPNKINFYKYINIYFYFYTIFNKQTIISFVNTSFNLNFIKFNTKFFNIKNNFIIKTGYLYSLNLLHNYKYLINILFKILISFFYINQTCSIIYSKFYYILSYNLYYLYTKQKIYIPYFYFEFIIFNLLKFVKILNEQKSTLNKNDIIQFCLIKLLNKSLLKNNYYPVLYKPIILSISKSILYNNGILSTLSFQETIKILYKSILLNKIDWIFELKSNIILSNITFL